MSRFIDGWPVARDPLALQFEAALLAHGVATGDTVAFYGLADGAWPAMLAGLLKIGGVAAFLPLITDERVLARMLAQCAPKFVVATGEAEAERIVHCMKSVPSIVQVILQHGKVRNPSIVSYGLLLQGGDRFREEKGDEIARREKIITQDDDAVIIYSAGTLAMPRCVRISHERLGNQVNAVAGKLGPGPALASTGRLDLVDQLIPVLAGIQTGRKVFFGDFPTEAYEWIAPAPAVESLLAAKAWPVVGPGALPKGFRGWWLRRRVRKALREAFPLMKGLHLGFSTPSSWIVHLVHSARMRVTWGYGLAEAHGYCTWEENGVGWGSLLPHVKLAMHAGKLVFDFGDNPSAWWQTTGDWARTVGPWIADLEPHGPERGDTNTLHAARRIERDIADHPWVASVFVNGPEPMAHKALVSLRPEPVYAWARANGITTGNWAGLLALPEIEEPILARVRAIGHRHGQTLDPVILAHGLNEHEGELTARGELRRTLVVRRAGSFPSSPRPDA